MRYIYKVRKDVLNADDGEFIVYGIDVMRNLDIVKSVSDLFGDRENAENFVRFCSSNNILPERIETVAEEVLDRPERIFCFEKMCG